MSKLLAKGILVSGLVDSLQANTQIEKVITIESRRKRIQTQLSRTYVAPKYDSKRNDPCPCGSGLKFKKCCINLKGE